MGESSLLRVLGGELFERIVERESYSEHEAQQVMRQLFSAIDYLHSIGIVHRDLKVKSLFLLFLCLVNSVEFVDHFCFLFLIPLLFFVLMLM